MEGAGKAPRTTALSSRGTAGRPPSSKALWSASPIALLCPADEHSRELEHPAQPGGPGITKRGAEGGSEGIWAQMAGDEYEIYARKITSDITKLIYLASYSARLATIIRSPHCTGPRPYMKNLTELE